MKPKGILAGFDEQLATIAPDRDTDVTAVQWTELDKAWRRLYLDNVHKSPCEHLRMSGVSGYCADCGNNVQEKASERNPASL